MNGQSRFCDFKANNILSPLINVSHDKCTQLCTQKLECTHYYWSRDTCWMKKGNISKNDAVQNFDSTSWCGFSQEKASNSALGIDFVFIYLVSLI